MNPTPTTIDRLKTYRDVLSEYGIDPEEDNYTGSEDAAERIEQHASGESPLCKFGGSGNPKKERTEMKKNIGCSDCDHPVTPSDPYYATPCGTFCGECMHEHARKCEVCAEEFDLKRGFTEDGKRMGGWE